MHLWSLPDKGNFRFSVRSPMGAQGTQIRNKNATSRSGDGTLALR